MITYKVDNKQSPKTAHILYMYEIKNGLSRRERQNNTVIIFLPFAITLC